MNDLLYGLCGLGAILVIVPLIGIPLASFYLAKDKEGYDDTPLGHLQWQADRGNAWAQTVLKQYNAIEKQRAYIEWLEKKIVDD